MPSAEPPAGQPTAPTALTLPEVEGRLSGADLSDWFNPFLPRFARETIRSGGRAAVVLEGGRLTGLLLSDPTERTSSVFTRSRAVAEALRREQRETAVYLEVDLGGPREVYGVHVGRLTFELPHRFRHPVQLLPPSELPRAAELVREVYGGTADRWLAVATEEGETCFGAEVDGRLAGVAWLLVEGGHARLQGLTVRPGYRRLGVGTDLVFARLAFAQGHGARSALSEISERNVGSRTIAERAGMTVAGHLFLYGAHAGTDPGRGFGPFGGAAPTSS